MRFVPTPIAGAYVVELDLLKDERGFFARSFCVDEFRQRGLESGFEQCNISFNRQRGTLRGLHYQAPPYAEAKLVRCIKGAVYDVIVDLRSGGGYGAWHGLRLDAENRLALYAPAGVAHGYVTLEDETELFYQMSRSYHEESARGVLWNDPAIGIRWPIEKPIVSARDAAWPGLAGQSTG